MGIVNSKQPAPLFSKLKFQSRQCKSITMTEQGPNAARSYFNFGVILLNKIPQQILNLQSKRLKAVVKETVADIAVARAILMASRL